MAGEVRRLFRIEGAVHAPSDRAETRHREVMAALEALRREPAAAAPATSPPDDTAREMLEHYKRELAEARKLKVELDAITAAIARTKQEIASLHEAGSSGGAMHRVSDELGAVVGGTESATNTILHAAETIDERARDLAAKLSGDDQGMAGDIADQVMRIFEACNFQDLTGQRITKVVAALRFVDERVTHMMEIWGGLESFKDVKASASTEARGDGLLNGPALPTDEGRATQDMIDALFD